MKNITKSHKPIDEHIEKLKNKLEPMIKIFFDVKKLEVYCNIFPELTPCQTITCIMFSMGIQVACIAELRNISHYTVRCSLNESRKRMGLSSMSCVISSVLIRLVINMTDTLLNIKARTFYEKKQS